MESVRYHSILLIVLAMGIPGGECLAQKKDKPINGQTAALVAEIDAAVVEEFRKAWRVAGAGTHEIEGVVLLYRNPDGTITARSQGQTNQRRRFTFALSSDVIAIVHTHPNSCNAKPEGGDLQIADRLRIPVFTITNRGMYVYDPVIRKISKVRDGVDWLNPASWAGDSTVAINRQ